MEALKKGQYAMTYVGEMTIDVQANARFQQVTDKGGNPSYQTEMQLTNNPIVVIDATYGGNVSRVVNHSCDPYLFLRKVYNRGTLYPNA